MKKVVLGLFYLFNITDIRCSMDVLSNFKRAGSANPCDIMIKQEFEDRSNIAETEQYKQKEIALLQLKQERNDQLGYEADDEKNSELTEILSSSSARSSSSSDGDNLYWNTLLQVTKEYIDIDQPC